MTENYKKKEEKTNLNKDTFNDKLQKYKVGNQ